MRLINLLHNRGNGQRDDLGPVATVAERLDALGLDITQAENIARQLVIERRGQP